MSFHPVVRETRGLGLHQRKQATRGLRVGLPDRQADRHYERTDGGLGGRRFERHMHADAGLCVSEGRLSARPSMLTDAESLSRRVSRARDAENRTTTTAGEREQKNNTHTCCTREQFHCPSTHPEAHVSVSLRVTVLALCLLMHCLTHWLLLSRSAAVIISLISKQSVRKRREETERRLQLKHTENRKKNEGKNRKEGISRKEGKEEAKGCKRRVTRQTDGGIDVCFRTPFLPPILCILSEFFSFFSLCKNVSPSSFACTHTLSVCVRDARHVCVCRSRRRGGSEGSGMSSQKDCLSVCVFLDSSHIRLGTRDDIFSLPFSLSLSFLLLRKKLLLTT